MAVMMSEPLNCGEEQETPDFLMENAAQQLLSISAFKLQFQLQVLLTTAATEWTHQTPDFIFSLKRKPNSCGDALLPDCLISFMWNILLIQNTKELGDTVYTVICGQS